jgi:hypothetical protein
LWCVSHGGGSGGTGGGGGSGSCDIGASHAATGAMLLGLSCIIAVALLRRRT